MVHRRYINPITNLEDAQGNPILDHEELETELVRYYKEILSEPPIGRTLTINRVTQHILSHITPKQNQALMRPITQEEVDHAIKEMPLGNELGPDGLTTNFFHFCWPMIREDVWKLVEES